MRRFRGSERLTGKIVGGRESTRRRTLHQAAVEALEERRLYHAGDLDKTFSGDGVAANTPGGQFVVASMDTRGGRTVILGGTSQAAPGIVGGAGNIVAYNNSGNIDTTFSSDGIRPMPRLTDPHDIFIQPDGKILVAGKVDGVAGVARMLKNGGADTSFSGDGFVTIPQMTVATSVRLTSSGKIVISGISTGTAQFAAARLMVNGSMDKSFSGDGFVQLNIDGPANAVAVQSDDKIVLVGTTPDNGTLTGAVIAVARLTTSGAMDTSFSGDGWTNYRSDSGSAGTAVDLTPAGRILVGASFHDTAGFLRLTKNGDFDAANTDAITEGASYVAVNNIRSSFDGNQIYVFTDFYDTYNAPDHSTVTRFDSDTTLDHTFGDGGFIAGGGEGHGDLEADGKVITAGNPVVLDAGGHPAPDFSRVQAHRRIQTIDNNDRIQLLENIVVEGTTGDDKITITRNITAATITVKLNGTTKTFSESAIFELNIDGGKGNDTIDIRGTHLTGDIWGGEGNDTIYGDTRADHIHGGEGNDTIISAGGDDEIWGDAGDDLLNAGEGNDTAYGGDGKDRVYGYGGDDQLSGMQPTKVDHLADYIDGGTGTDTVFTKESVDATSGIELEA